MSFFICYKVARGKVCGSSISESRSSVLRLRSACLSLEFIINQFAERSRSKHISPQFIVNKFAERSRSKHISPQFIVNQFAERSRSKHVSPQFIVNQFAERSRSKHVSLQIIKIIPYRIFRRISFYKNRFFCNWMFELNCSGM